MQEVVWDYYSKHGRDMPWRQPEADGQFDPYKIMVSELMLQQTQVSRVIPKFQEFIERFPTVSDLAQASLGEVLQAWSGLGYNRRAKFLYQAVQQIGDQPFPRTLTELVALPGVGPNTAAAIMVYTYNEPLAFVETNIRTVYIHHYFHDQTDVSDKQLMPIIEATIDREHPREWFWALMDYGAHLKATVGNLSRHSRHYARQSKFEGSRRQIRGHILRLLGDRPHTKRQLATVITDERLASVIDDLMAEGLIMRTGQSYSLPKD